MQCNAFRGSAHLMRRDSETSALHREAVPRQASLYTAARCRSVYVPAAGESGPHRVEVGGQECLWAAITNSQ